MTIQDLILEVENSVRTGELTREDLEIITELTNGIDCVE